MLNDYDRDMIRLARSLGVYDGCVLVTSTGVRIPNVREDSIILAGAKKEFVSFEVYGSDRIHYVATSHFWTEAMPV